MIKNYQQKEKLLKHLTAAVTAASVLEFRNPNYRKCRKLIEKALKEFYTQVSL